MTHAETLKTNENYSRAFDNFICVKVVCFKVVVIKLGYHDVRLQLAE